MATPFHFRKSISRTIPLPKGYQKKYHRKTLKDNRPDMRYNFYSPWKKAAPYFR
jgi:hypothetical protein